MHATRDSKSCVHSWQNVRLQQDHGSCGRGPRTLASSATATLENGAEWAWQAKYFHTLGASQWSQIDGSVRSAMKKHPGIRRYIVCCPLDLPDGRSGKTLSARERWKRYVGKWKSLAADAGTAVEFTYWGSHELLDRLARPEHSGRVRFWFGAPTMDETWFERRVDEAVATAGPRYTPALHIDLPIAGQFEAFGRTEWFFDNVIRTARELWSEWEQTCSIHSLDYRQEGNRDLEAEIRRLHGDCEINRAKEAAGRVVKRTVAAASAVDVQPAGPPPFAAIAELIEEAGRRSGEHCTAHFGKRLQRRGSLAGGVSIPEIR